MESVCVWGGCDVAARVMRERASSTGNIGQVECLGLNATPRRELSGGCHVIIFRGEIGYRPGLFICLFQTENDEH